MQLLITYWVRFFHRGAFNHFDKKGITEAQLIADWFSCRNPGGLRVVPNLSTRTWPCDCSHNHAGYLLDLCPAAWLIQAVQRRSFESKHILNTVCGIPFVLSFDKYNQLGFMPYNPPMTKLLKISPSYKQTNTRAMHKIWKDIRLNMPRNLKSSKNPEI